MATAKKMVGEWYTVLMNKESSDGGGSNNNVETKIEEAKKWAVSKDLFYAASDVVDGLPSGLYNCGVSQQIGPYLQKIVCDTDHLIFFKDSPSYEVLD